VSLTTTRRNGLARLWSPLRRRLRASEFWLILLAVVIGGAAGVLAVVQARLAHGLQWLLYGIDLDQRLSALPHIDPARLVWLPVGGLVLGGVSWLMRRGRTRAPVDVVEANALHGGRLSLYDSLTVCVQTVISNGFGASVGLEAAYAQAGGVVASAAGDRLRVRRNDLRTLVGAGAGAAIGAAFGAPLTGAFYAFEIVIGSYTPSAIAPVAAAALCGVLTSQIAGGLPYVIHLAADASPEPMDYLLYSVVGLICALMGIAVMRLVAQAEQLVVASPLPAPLRPAVGGGLLALLAMISPQVMSSGHGALHLDFAAATPAVFLVTIFALKAVGSIVSLSFGFRGGLFFASLLLGSLLGHAVSQALDMAQLGVVLPPENAALVGMGAMAVAIVGGPLTMSFLILETTHDFGVTAATLAASLVASATVRERFGYSFSTWRLHLRGETIRSARDIGWIKTLTAGRMMRRDTETMAASSTLAEFRRRFPLGSVSRVVVVDEAQRYAGVVLTADAYGQGADPEATVGGLAINQDTVLTPDMNIVEVMELFDRTETEELAVVDPDLKVLGLLAEAYVARRYARELEKIQMELFGES